MNPQQYDGPQKISYPDSYIEDEDREPGLMDAIRFLYQRWIRLVFHAGIIFLLGALVFIYWHSKSPRAVVGVVGLDFPEIRKNAYPSGRRFSLEDFRSPRVVTQALADAAISNERWLPSA